jgi:CDP-glucose 4,6-dehydratase
VAGLAVSPKNLLIARIAGHRVFVTGHTGFKGSWMLHWLHGLGCEITGYALPPATVPDMYTLSGADQLVARSYLRDIRDSADLADALSAAKPEIVFHMAAQPLVRRAYRESRVTWDVNVMGTVNLLDAARQVEGLRAIIVITTDKIYENRGETRRYSESDSLGGHDPYSASKAAAELVVQSYRKSFFCQGDALLASARGGNVIGGGDWSDDRLLADAARSAAAGKVLVVRNPHATRPWQHVLDCLSGYLTLAGALLERREGSDSAYNFGPSEADSLTVGALLDKLKGYWPKLDWRADENGGVGAPYEASFLSLDTTKALVDLGWTGSWPVDEALRNTADWYRGVIADPTRAPSLTVRQLDEYLAR